MILIIFKRLGILSVVAALAFLAAACRAPTSEAAGLRVVATTSILGDVVSNLADEVEVLIPIGADPHAFQPSPQQAQLVSEADLVVANGLGLEEGLAGLLEAAEAEGTLILEVGCLAEPLPRHGQTNGGCGPGIDIQLDPHFWLDPVRLAGAVGLIAQELDRAGDAEALGRAEEYGDRVLEAHRVIQDRFQTTRGAVVTNHDFLRYFADRYSLEVAGVVIPSGSTLSEPSAGDLADLIQVMEDLGVTVILTESTDPSRLAEAVASEVDHEVSVVPLHVGSLGPSGSGAETYIGLLEVNGARIAEVLSRA